MAMNGMGSYNLFEKSILDTVDFSNNQLFLKYGICPSNAGDNLILRPLSTEDYDKGYLELLTQLTVVGDISREKFLERFMEMKSCRNSYYIVVIEDVSTKKIVGSGTLAVELKYIHRAALRGRVEDIVVDQSYRKRHLGRLLVDTLTILSEKIGCYKTSLDCREALIPFYNQSGFAKEEDRNYLCKRFFN